MSPTFKALIPTALTPTDPTATPFVHLVSEGETLLVIAIRYGVTLDDLLLVNPGIDPRALSVGQSLRIPGPGGEALDVLLPTPTPLPLEMKAAHCYPSVGEGLRCLIEVQNLLGSAAENVAARIFLIDPQGVIIEQAQASGLMRLVSQGETVLLEGSFTSIPEHSYRAQAQIVSAVLGTDLELREIPVNLTRLDLEWLAQERLIQFDGSIELDDDQVQEPVLLTVVASGYNDLKQPIGYNALQVILAPSDFPFDFSLHLFSLAGGFDAYEFQVQAIQQPEK